MKLIDCDIAEAAVITVLVRHQRIGIHKFTLPHRLQKDINRGVMSILTPSNNQT